MSVRDHADLAMLIALAATVLSLCEHAHAVQGPSGRPRCAFVLPSATSSNISDARPNGNGASVAKHADPGHYVCMPGGGRTPRGLLVFTPGLAAADYTMFAQAAADTGLAVAVISQPDLCSSTCCSVKGLNCSSTEPAVVRAVQQCSYAERMMHLVGDDAQWQHRSDQSVGSPAVWRLPVTAEANSTIGRLKALLAHFGGNRTFGSLSSFLDARGRPKWRNITAAGHSCASYYPLMLATLHKLHRVVMTGGVGQPLFGADANRPLMLDPNDVYGFVRSSDCSEAKNGTQCASVCEACTSPTCTFAENENDYRMLGLPGQSSVFYNDVLSGDDRSLAKKLAGARQLFDHNVCHFKGRPIMTHLCEMCDLQTRRYSNGSAVRTNSPAVAAILCTQLCCRSCLHS